MLPKSWPQWSLILIGIALACAAIVLGLMLEPYVMSLGPERPEPTPTLPQIDYTLPDAVQSCRECHFSLEALQASADDPTTAEKFLNEPASILTPHGRLGCVACHAGDGRSDDKDVAHAGRSCDDCHLSTWDWHEVALSVHPMPLERRHAEISCFSCHEFPNFKGLESDCVDCHERPHDFGSDDCAVCHEPTSFKDGTLPPGFHSVSLTGAHAEVSCDACHTSSVLKPEFECSQCHSPAHDFGGDDCAQCHEPTSFKDAILPAELHPVPLTGAHAEASCDACHTDDAEPLEFVCSQCHEPPASHPTGSCEDCHSPDGWRESAAAIAAASPQIPHTLKVEDNCQTCHDSGQFKVYPENHNGRTTDTCQTCHALQAAVADAEHLFPQDHNGANTNCVLCHLDGDFTTYQCNTCHSSETLQPIHEEQGIGDTERLCTYCHPQGKKPL